MTGFTRDRLTWMLYAVLAWFAYLQAAPGLVVPQLRDELEFSHTVAGLHVAAFAAGATAAGAFSALLERVLGRTRLLWSAAAVLALGTLMLTLAGVVGATVGSIAVMGAGGGLVLATVQAGLADHHVEQRGVALAEANVAAALSYLALAGVLSLAGAVDLSWRLALLLSLAVPVATWTLNRGERLDAVAPPQAAGDGRLPALFWVAAAMMTCATGAEWCITSWGATYVEEVVGASRQAAVTTMAGYFGGVAVGRVLGSRLARRHDPARMFAAALGVTLLGFAVLWPSPGPDQAAIGLIVLGIGLGNLFPMGLSVAVAVAPDRSTAASGRVVLVTSAAVLVAPLGVGTLADGTSLRIALGVVPALIVLAAVALALVLRGVARSAQGATAPRRPMGR